MGPTTQKGGQSVFVGGTGTMERGKPKDMVLAIGYIRPEDNHWVAVCINMCLVGQGETPTEALDTLMESVDSYVQFVRNRYPGSWQSKLECSPPAEFVKEFKRISAEIGKVFELEEKKAAQRAAPHPWSPARFRKKSTRPGYSFVQPVAAAYAEATV